MTIRKIILLKHAVCAAIFIMFLLFGSIVQAADIPLSAAEKKWLKEHPVIRVGHGVEWPPFSLFKNQKPMGLSVDYLNLAASKAGLKLEYQPVYSFVELLKMGQDKKVDLIHSVTKTKTRSEYLAFTKPYKKNPSAIFMKKGSPPINSIKDIIDKNIAVGRGFYQEEIIRERYPKIKLTRVESSLEGLKAVSFGTVDAFVDELAVGNYILAQNFLTNVAVAGGTGLADYVDVNIRFAVRKDWPILVSILEKGMDAISESQKAQINSKWSSLAERPVLHLTDDEKNWLKSHPVIRVMGETDYPPWDFVRNGQAAGYSIDYVKLLADRLGVRLTFDIAPYGDQIGKVQARKLDMLHTTSSFELDGVLFSKPYGRFLQVIIARDDRSDIKSEQDLSGKRVAIAKGDEGIQMLKRAVSDVQSVECIGYREVLMAILDKKADAGIMDRSVAHHLIRKHLLNGLSVVAQVAGTRFDPNQEMRLGVRSDWPVFLEALEKAMDSITTEEMDALNHKWLRQLKKTDQIELSSSEKAWLAKHKSIELGFTPDLQPLLIQAEDKELTGILPDIFDQLKNYTGLNVSIEARPWPETIEQARKGEIDGLVLCVPNLAKEAGLLATKGYISTIPVIFGKKDAPFKINSLNDLKGKRVAHLKSIKFLENILARFGDETTVIEADSFIAAVTMVMEGKADVVLGMNFNTYTLHQSVLTGIEPIFIDSSYLIKGVTAVRSDWPELVGILNKGLVAIGEAQINQIIRKWTQIERTGQKLILTKSERAWLNDHPVIRVGTDQQWNPIEFLDSDGNYKGLAIDYLKKIENLLGVKFKLIPENWQALIDRAKKQELDLFTSVASTPERKKYLSFTEPYIQMPAGIFAREDTAYITDLKQIKGKQISVVEGYAIADYLAAHHPYLNLVLVKNTQEGIRKVKQKKAFAFIDNIITTGHIISHKGYIDIKLIGEVPFVYAQRMGVRKDWQQFRDILQKAINAIPDADRNAIYNKWVPVTYEKPIDYSLIWKITAGAMILICIIVFWNLRLKYEVGKKTAELKENEQKYHNLFQFSRDGVLIFSLDRRILDVNEQFVTLSGFTRDEVLSLRLSDLFPEARTPESDKRIQSMLDGNEIDLFETDMHCNNGKKEQVEINVTKLENCYEEKIVFQANIRDITSRKRHMEVLAARLRLSEFSVTHSVEQLLKECLDEAEKLTGSCIGFIHYLGPDQKTLTLQRWSTNTLKHMCTAKGKGKHYDIDHAGVWVEGIRKRQPVIHNDYENLKNRKGLPKGHAPVIRELVVPIFRGDKIVAIIGVGNKENDYVEADIKAVEDLGDFLWDILLRRKAEEEKSETEKRLKAIFNHRFQLTGLLSPDGKLLMANENVCRLVGVDFKEIKGAYLWELPHWEHSKTLQDEIRKAVESVQKGKLITIETTHPDAEGNIHYIDFSLTPVRDEKGEIIFIVPEGHDITKRKKSEDDRKNLEKQLAQAQKMEAIGTLAGGIAHDFNNILSSIMGYTELAREDIPKESETASYINQVFKAGQRASDLVKQILTFSRKQDRELVPLKVGLVIKEAVKLLRSSIPTTIEIKSDINPNCGLVLADPTQIHQIIMNLCTNSYHAMKELGGKLSISLQPINIGTEEKTQIGIRLERGSYLEMTISDTGCGIPEELLEKIFEPYYTTKEKGEGTGLGLATVHSIIRNFNGEIIVKSRVGDGTTFFVYLPVIKEIKLSASKGKEAGEVFKGAESILFVDDEKTVVDFSKIMLEGLGYQFIGFTESLQALEAFKIAPDDVDLLVTDMTMPKMTGEELIRQIKKIRPDLPVILCTGYSDVLSPERIKQIGVSEYLEKPILKKDLAAKIRKTLERHKPS